MTPFMAAYRKALGQPAEPMPVVELDPELEPLTAEQVNARIRESENRIFLTCEPSNNQRRVLHTDTRYGGDCSL